MLEIQRDRSAEAMRQAEANADRMQIRSPIAGIAVIKTTWKGSSMAEIQEGDEVRPGMAVVDVVNPAAMRVRARVNQADIRELRVGQSAQVGLDAYPDLHFAGRVSQISPIGVQSSLSPKVRNFIVLFAVNGSHPNLMPDLTASLDVELDRVEGALVVPRSAVHRDGNQAYVDVRRGGRFERQNVTLGEGDAQQVAISSGLTAGSIVRTTDIGAAQ